MKKIEKFNEFLNTEYNINIKMLFDNFWHECGNKSELNIIYENKYYKEIINQGYKSIPYIFENLSVVWLNALEKITNIKLYEEYSLNTTEMKNLWKKWGEENGYL